IPPNPRLTNSQKSIRTNDIENVGRTARHHTLFEMLGNFSIGDYFKVEAIEFAWEFLTREVGLSPDALYISVHPEDTEAVDIWHNTIGLPLDRIIALADNFWDIGPGPCGPNSEIYYDRGANWGCSSPTCRPGCDCDRYLEVWNLVFSQFNHHEDGTYSPLPRKNIDTGMSLERLASVVQNVESNFETDFFTPYIGHLTSLTGKGYHTSSQVKLAMNIISDHLRAIVFAIGDGVNPNNEGRGYVLRRLLRRAVRFGQTIGLNKPFLGDMVPLVFSVMGEHYPELEAKIDFTTRIVRLEEERFLETLEDGLAMLTQFLAQLRQSNSGQIPGEVAFRLYDTYGFPVDLTEDIGLEEGFTVDQEGFDACMAAQRSRARAARGDNASDFGHSNLFSEISTTKFVGEIKTASTGQVLGIIRRGEKVHNLLEGDNAAIILDCTPMYAESGGQVGDSGILTWADGEFVVEKAAKYFGEFTLHQGTLRRGKLSLGERVLVQVDKSRRMAISRAHSATHLLHSALRTILGDHATQAGSSVEPDRLRFDFSHFAPVTAEELIAIEDAVNEYILQSLQVTSQEMKMDEAKAIGAISLFGEKYGGVVRVVHMGEHSIELCGGTHLENTSRIAHFRLLSEQGIGAGLRRIEAVVGEAAHRLAKERDAQFNT
ncbi:MAG: alanine--tRNA ligase, partial [bacterium]|nr:alanine--tRNA ligase [bacterium]